MCRDHNLYTNIYVNNLTVSTLRLRIHTYADYRTLNCWAVNSQGIMKDPCVFEIFYSSPAFQSLECDTKHKSKDILQISCFDCSELNDNYYLDMRDAYTGGYCGPTALINQHF